MKEIDEKDVEQKVVEEEPVKYAPTENLQNMTDIDAIFQLGKDAKLTEAHGHRVEELLGFIKPTDEWKKSRDELNQRVIFDEKGNDIRPAFGAASFHAGGDNRQTSVFITWLMGAKDMSFSDALKMGPAVNGFDNYIKEFHTFLKAHPVNGQNAKENTEAWARIFGAACNKIKEYRIPVVDYSDRDNLPENATEVFAVFATIKDISQEYSCLRGNAKRLGWIQDVFGSADKMAENMEPVNVLDGFTREFNNAFVDNGLYAIVKNSGYLPEDKYTKAADARLNFTKIIAPAAAGKTVGEILQAQKATALYSAFFAAAKTTVKYEENEARDYLAGKKEISDKRFLDGYNNAKDVARKNFNATPISDVANFRNEVLKYAAPLKEESDEKDLTNRVFGNREPKDFASFLNSDHQDVETLKANINKCFSLVFDMMDNAKFFRMAGITTQTDLFKVDGKTPKEIWGKKYSFVKSEAELDMLLKAELYKEMLHGKSNITCDTFVINKNDKIVKIGDYHIMHDQASMDKKVAYLKGIRSLHNKYDKMLQELIATQDDKEANLVPGKVEGSPSYKAMFAAIKKLVDMTDFEKNEMTVKGLESALQDLKKASNAYYEAHTGIHIFSAVFKDGKKRLNISDFNRKEGFKEDIQLLKDIVDVAGIDIIASSNMAHDFYKPYAKDIWEKMQQESRIRNDIHSFTSLKQLDEANSKTFTMIQNKAAIRKTLDTVEKNDLSGGGLEALDSMFDKHLSDYAKQYVKMEYLARLKNAEKYSYSETVDDLNREVMGEDFAKEYHESVANVMKDPKFRELYHKNPKTCIAEYGKVVEKQDKEYFDSLLKEGNAVYTGLYKANSKTAPARFKAGYCRLNQWNKEISNVDSFLENYGKNMLHNKELFDKTSPKYDQLQNDAYDEISRKLALKLVQDEINQKGFDAGMDIATKPEEFSKMQNFIKEGLKKENFLKSNTYSTVSLVTNRNAMYAKAKKFVVDGLVKEDNEKANAKGEDMNHVQKMANQINKNKEIQKNVESNVKKNSNVASKAAIFQNGKF